VLAHWRCLVLRLLISLLSPAAAKARRTAKSRATHDIADVVALASPTDKTAMMSFDGKRYSVLPEDTSRTLQLVVNDAEVRLLDGERVGSAAKGMRATPL
jgi:hypothetical protein